MRRLLSLLALAGLMWTAPVGAATPLDVARSQAAQARERTNDLRSRQMGLRMELNALAARIEQLKARQKGALMTGSDLDASLRRSQELSGTLTQLAQQLSSAEATLEQENLALLGALNAELEALRKRWEATSDRRTRADTVARMRTLRLEREQIRAMLPASRVPALQNARSDDPEDLMEQADALRDSEDKVRQRMKALEGRIAELRDERELDRRMNDFLGDQSMFDDEDRRLRRTLENDLQTQRQPPLFGAGAASEAAAPEVTAGGSAGDPNAPPSGMNGDVRGDTAAPRPSPMVSITERAKHADGRPAVGGADALLLGDLSGGDLEAMEAQLQKMKQLATQLDHRADDLEKKARELE